VKYLAAFSRMYCLGEEKIGGAPVRARGIAAGSEVRIDY